MSVGFLLMTPRSKDAVWRKGVPSQQMFFYVLVRLRLLQAKAVAEVGRR
jgi:hypothetical protein